MSEQTRARIRGYRAGIALLGLLLGLCTAAGASAQTYELVDLGLSVSPEDVNNEREVVGSRTRTDGTKTSFLFTPDGTRTDIVGTVAWAVNDAGRIVGQTPTGAFVLDRDGNLAEQDDAGAFGLSESGVVSGNYALDNPYRATPRPLAPALSNGTLWEYLDIAHTYPRGTRLGVYADLFVLWDVNEAGIAVGGKSRYGLAGSQALMTDPAFESVEYLPTPYGGRAFAINERNQIVGVTGESSSTGTFAHAFLYEAGSVTDLGTLGGGLRSSAADINESSQVVGSSWLVTELTSLYLPDQYHAFVWDETAEMRDLNDLVDAPGWVLTAASAINDGGDIVGVGLKDGEPHGFLLLEDATAVSPPAANEPPVAVASSDVSRGSAPLTVQFDASGSSDPDGSALSYHWDFGDGITSSELGPAHSYETEGNYLVVLTVTDAGGLSDSAQLEISVRRARGRKK